MTIYVVTRGEYSDYKIIGVFTNKAKAERFSEVHQGERGYSSEESQIEEYEADDFNDPHPGWLTFLVEMRENGDSSVRREPPADEDHPDQPYGGHSAFCFHIWARDKEHAVKIANERRLQMIANGTWTVDWDTWREHVKSGRVREG